MRWEETSPGLRHTEEYWDYSETGTEVRFVPGIWSRRGKNRDKLQFLAKKVKKVARTFVLCNTMIVFNLVKFFKSPYTPCEGFFCCQGGAV